MFTDNPNYQGYTEQGALHLEGQLVGLTIRPASAVIEAVQAALLVTRTPLASNPRKYSSRLLAQRSDELSREEESACQMLLTIVRRTVEQVHGADCFAEKADRHVQH